MAWHVGGFVDSIPLPGLNRYVEIMGPCVTSLTLFGAAAGSGEAMLLVSQ